MPFAVQRTLSMVPFLNLDPSIRGEAQGSTDWRINMWSVVLPGGAQVSHLGQRVVHKRQRTDRGHLNQVPWRRSGRLHSCWSLHSGPLSLIIPFGLPGVFAFLWLIGAGTRVLWKNYRYGDPAMMRINAFLLAAFLARTVFFLAVFGEFFGDLIQLPVCWDERGHRWRGVCQPVLAPGNARSKNCGWRRLPPACRHEPSGSGAASAADRVSHLICNDEAAGRGYGAASGTATCDSP